MRAVHAWSAMKVPLVVAVVAARRAGELPGGRALTAQERQAIGAAISASDNDAAGRLYGELVAAFGGDAPAVARIQRVLERAGDPTTRVEAEVTRPGFTNDGQTVWSLHAMARFYRALAWGCLARPADSRLITEAMRAPEAVQRWGAVPAPWPAPARVGVKGGWGPTAAGGGEYEVLQASVIATPRAGVVLVVATTGPGTTFAVGQRRATRLARTVARGTRELPRRRDRC